MFMRHVVSFLGKPALSSGLLTQLGASITRHRSLLYPLISSPFLRMSLASAAPVGDARIGDGPMPNVVFVLGAPGSGKGTQCPLIVRDFGYVHLSAGDLLRQERETKDSPYGELILHHMKQGTIVPVEITCSLLEAAMKTSGKQDFLIDGFPRNQNNLEGWIRQMGNKTNLQFVLHLEVSRDQCIQRCLARGASSGRPDDNLESLGKRFDTYVNDTLPIIEYYRAKGLVRTVSTVPAPEKVHVEISSIFKAVNGKSAQGKGNGF